MEGSNIGFLLAITTATVMGMAFKIAMIFPCLFLLRKRKSSCGKGSGYTRMVGMVMDSRLVLRLRTPVQWDRLLSLVIQLH